MYLSLFNANVVTLFSHYDTAPDLIHVAIYQRVLTQWSLRQPEYMGCLLGGFPSQLMIAIMSETNTG